MVKVKSWLFTEVRGKVKKAEFRRRKNKVTELSQKRIPFNPRTPAQQEVRKTYGKCVEEWNKLSESEKRQWRIIGTLQGISGYNAFMRECISERLGKIWYEITIDNSDNSNDLTDYQVLLEIVNDSTFFEDCKNEQKYLEFYDTDKSTLLNHFVEEFDTTNKNAKIWIKVPSIPANATKTIYLKINTSRTTDLSNPYNVFDFYDDFENLENWDTHTSLGNVSISNSILILDGDADASGGINGVRSKSTFSKPLIIEFKLKITAPTSNYAWKQFGIGDTDLSEAYLNGGNNLILRNQETDKIYFMCKKDGNETTVNVDSITSWHIESIYWGDVAKNLWDYEPKAEISTNVPTIQLYIMIGVGNNAGENAIECDWVRTRKYTEPEPTVSYAKMS